MKITAWKSISIIAVFDAKALFYFLLILVCYLRLLYFPPPPLLSSSPITAGGVPPGDAWTPPHRLYAVAERLILLVAGLVGRGWGRDEGVAPPPTLLPTAFWERELGPGAELEGHSTLFSPLNPSVTCHMFVMNVERETAEAGKGGGSGEKRTVKGRFWSFFPLPSVTMTDEGLISH